jgi:hypothetical protein
MAGPEAAEASIDPSPAVAPSVAQMHQVRIKDMGAEGHPWRLVIKGRLREGNRAKGDQSPFQAWKQRIVRFFHEPRCDDFDSKNAGNAGVEL